MTNRHFRRKKKKKQKKQKKKKKTVGVLLVRKNVFFLESRTGILRMSKIMAFKILARKRERKLSSQRLKNELNTEAIFNYSLNCNAF